MKITAFYRMSLICGGLINGVISQAQSNLPANTTQVGAATTVLPLPAAYVFPGGQVKVNYVRTHEAVAPNNTATVEQFNAINDYWQTKEATAYVDGLGRPLQTVIRKATSGNAPKDIVSMNIYDPFGIETVKYMPYVATSNDGLLKTNPFVDQQAFYTTQYRDANNELMFKGEQVFYSQTEFEASPLNRPTKTMAQGNSWAGKGKGVGMEYRINDANDQVRIWQIDNNPVITDGSNIPTSIGTYAAGELFENVTIDENNKQIVEYKDKEGRIILKKVQLDNTPSADHAGWLCTYYVYDDFGQLRFVIPPKAVKQLSTNYSWMLTNQQLINELCFRYEYDERNRMIAKKVPGAGWVFMVYDRRDRLVLTSSAGDRIGIYSGGICKWTFIVYDELNRALATGQIENCLSREALQTIVKGMSNENVPIQVITDFGNETIIAYNPVVSSISQCLSCSNILFNTISYYDDYNWQGLIAYTNIYNNKLNATINPNAVVSIKSNMTFGLATGSKIRVLENATTPRWITTTSYYDDRNRVIQSATRNCKGGLDVATNLYDFSGKVLSSYLVHTNPTATTDIGVLSNMEYDHTGKLLKASKVVYQPASSNTIVLNTTIVENEYDELGQLKRKKIGQQKDAAGAYTTTPIETLDYNYNIRGWLKGVNMPYANPNNAGSSSYSNKWFGMELSYDWGFTNNQINGNIAGVQWKAKGDGVQRAYGFGYDNVNRFMSADFKENNSGWHNASTIDYTTTMGDGVDPTTAYDENGNILQMQQMGYKLGGSVLIDDLRYSYMNNSNKLRSVTEASGYADEGLGDFFHSRVRPNRNIRNGIRTDYMYDVNGNLTKDWNKDISGNEGIEYNYLNLPEKITVQSATTTPKGTVSYLYDAAGNKLEKTVNENATATNNNTATTKTTTYLGGFIYEATSPAPTGGTTNPELQFFGHEEGRVRLKKTTVNNVTTTSYVVDYMLKDHLGNVRTVLTDEQQKDIYQAGMETADNGFETALFGNAITSTRSPKLAGFDGVPDQDPQNQQVSKLQAHTNAGQNLAAVGPSVLLKVMAGDKINISSNFWQQGSSTSANNLVSSDLAYLLTNALSGNLIGVSDGKINAITLENGTNIVGTQITNFLGNQPSTGPKAYLNWILLDEEQLKMVQQNNNTGMVQAPSNFNAGDAKVFLQANGGQPIEMKKNGYLYVYVSSEVTTPVYFDKIRVEHVRGPLLEETQYYPFGLVMKGISSKSASKLENKYKYNSIEQNNSFEINTLEAFYRTNDPQIGRWWGIDTKPDLSISPYSSMANNPALFTDFLGDTTIYFNIQTGEILGTINNAGATTRVKINASAYNVAYGAVTAVGFNLNSQNMANGFVNALNNTLVGIDIATGENNIAFETGENELEFTGSALNVVSHFDDNSTLNVNTISASSGIVRTNGTYVYDPLPDGSYTVNNGRPRGRYEVGGGFYRDGIAFTFDVNPNFTEVNGQPMERTNLRIHPDGNSLGSAGCVALATDQVNLQAFYTQTRAYIQQHGSIQLTVTLPNNPNVAYDRHLNDRRRSSE
jgi:Domain of unknown function (DUF6443)